MIIYGFVVNNVFYSENMKAKLKTPRATGIYQLDLNHPEYTEGIEFADVARFRKYIKKSKKIVSLTAFTFHKGFIPLDYVKWMKKGFIIPMPLLNPESCNEWQVIRVYYIKRHNVFIFGEWLTNPLQITLFDIKDQFTGGFGIEKFRGVTPEMRILYSLHSLEKIKRFEELKRLRVEEFKKTLTGRLKIAIESAGGKYIDHKVRNHGVIDVSWECMGEHIITMLDKDLNVESVGFCVSGYDNTQSLGSAVNLLQQYKDDDDHIYKTVVRDDI